MSRRKKGTCLLTKAIYILQMVSHATFLMKGYGNVQKYFFSLVESRGSLVAAAIHVFICSVNQIVTQSFYSKL